MLAAALGCAAGYGQSARGRAERAAKTVAVPFVGCPSFGQVESVEAPKGTSQRVAIGEEAGRALAYYKSADGISVLAPRGWYCQGVSGSGGAALYLGPGPIVHFSDGWEGLDGAAMEVDDFDGGASGRYEIAEVIARVFPRYRALADRNWGLDTPLPSGPYPKDTLRYRGDTVVEYRTPARTEGLGNFNSRLGKNELPIVGVAILLPGSSRSSLDDSHLLRLSVRFPPELARLAPAIVHYAER